MKSSTLKLVGTVLIGYSLYRRFSKKNITDKENAIEQLLAFSGIGIIIYGVMK